MSARSKARKKALDILYEAEARGVAAADVLDATTEAAQQPLNPYTAELVWGVVEHADRIDDLLATYSLGWTIDRMPAVDRNLLRIGTYEILWGDDVGEHAVLADLWERYLEAA